MVSIVFGVLGFGLVIATLRPYAHVWANVMPLIILAAVWVALLWAAPWIAARKQFWKQPTVQGPRTLLLDPAGVHSRWNGGSSDNEWKNYIRAVEGKNQFLMFTSPAAFNIVPKRALTPEQLSAFRAILAQKVPHRR